MIAPELQAPDENFVHRVGFQLGQHYPAATDSLQLRHPTTNFLLFPWTTPGVPFASRDDEDRWVRNRRLLDDRAGLYIPPDDVMTNTVTMLLPFPIERNGHVLRSDGTKVEKVGHDVLYEHGCCGSFLPAHGTSLEAVLANWGPIFVAGDWEVDEDGVIGGEENWRVADTEEEADYFQVELLCIPPEGDDENVGDIEDE
jgi:hypothetical protein